MKNKIKVLVLDKNSRSRLVTIKNRLQYKLQGYDTKRKRNIYARRTDVKVTPRGKVEITAWIKAESRRSESPIRIEWEYKKVYNVQDWVKNEAEYKRNMIDDLYAEIMTKYEGSEGINTLLSGMSVFGFEEPRKTLLRKGTRLFDHKDKRLKKGHTYYKRLM